MMIKRSEVISFLVFLIELQVTNADDASMASKLSEAKTVTISPTNPKPPSVTTLAPSSPPTNSPTMLPTVKPTGYPTPAPTLSPSAYPKTHQPTPAPTSFPTASPTTGAPSSAPTTTPTDDPTTSPSTLAPTLVPTNVPTTSPTSSPTTETPTNTPTTTPSASPTAFVLEPVPPIKLTNSTIVRGRCIDILESAKDVKELASYWEPKTTAASLYYSSPEGGASIEGFTPIDFLNEPISPVKITSPVDVAGTTCSMNLEAEACEIRALLELDKDGYLKSWMNAYSSSTCAGKDPLAAEEVTKTACVAAFGTVFPPAGQTLNSLMSPVVQNIFVPSVSTFAFPSGNPNATLKNITNGWTFFSFVMGKLNPFRMALTAEITSPMDVTGSVCSFDQELSVSFLINCSSFVVPGRVIMEVQGDQIVRLLSQFDNTTFWGGIDQCAMKEESEKQAKEAAKKREKEAKEAAKKQEKEAKKAAKKRDKEAKNAEKAKDKREKAEKKKHEKEAKAKRKKDKGKTLELHSYILQDFVGSAYSCMSKLEGVPVGWFVTIAVLAIAIVARRSNPRRHGYQEVNDVEDILLVN